MNKIAIAVHGGAGTIDRKSMSYNEEKLFRDGLEFAVNSGYKVLSEGGSSIDAVQRSVMILEDNPLFNAGRGSVFNSEGKVEMDASLMDGFTGKAGAVAGVRNIKNPVGLARLVMDQSPHVLLAGRGAEEFALKMGIARESDLYFYTEKRYQQYLIASKNNEIYLDHKSENKFGTVGAVAVDQSGNVAAATSTGGMTNKMFGRVGDSPLIGAGTFADNNSCAVSCTGHGEFFIRNVVAFDISCLINYKGLSLSEACQLVVKEKLVKAGGEGGVIAVSAKGEIALVFNSVGMYRAWKIEGTETKSAIWDQE
jgi:L-asparaginase / beta-aspartyl-peptidase